MIQELEGKFAEFDDYIITLSEKREEIYSKYGLKNAKQEKNAIYT